MYYLKRLIGGVLTCSLLFSSVNADFKITIPDLQVVSDGLNPTTGSFPVLLEVDGVGAPNISAPISSYNFQMDVTGVTGGITTVSTLSASAGDLFNTIPSQSFQFQTFSFGAMPLGFSEGANTLGQPNAPAPALLNTPVVLANIAFEIPAGQEGSFSVDLVPNSLEFYDDSLPVAAPYGGVNVSGGTITAVPEPSAFVLLGLICGLTMFGKKLKRRFGR